MIRVSTSLVAVLLASTAWGQTTSTLDVGEYTSHNLAGWYSGLMTSEGNVIGWFDYLPAFDDPKHVEADFLWFSTGSMGWDFPIELPPADAIVESVSFTVEVSSEYPGGRTDWPSPVTFSLAGVEVGKWTIPGDPNCYSYVPWECGRQENHLGAWDSQYGWLVTVTVDHEGTWLGYRFRTGDQEATLLSDVTLDDLKLASPFPVGIRLESERGINIYGDTWGDYDEDLTVAIEWSTVASECGEESEAPNHGQYVSCVVHYAQDLRDAGLIDQDEYTQLVTDSAHSSAGKK
jgi:predicted transcriptional regulator